jgi:hypothetical protein
MTPTPIRKRVKKGVPNGRATATTAVRKVIGPETAGTKAEERKAKGQSKRERKTKDREKARKRQRKRLQWQRKRTTTTINLKKRKPGWL